MGRALFSFLIVILLHYAVGKFTEQTLFRLQDHPQKCWVYFTDKSKNFSPEQFLTSLDSSVVKRRSKMSNFPLVSDHDYPISMNYITEVLRHTKEQKYVASQWLNAISIVISASEAHSISRLSFVKSIDIVATFRKPTHHLPEMDLKQSGYLQQLQQLGVDKLHQIGITGKNVKILVIDSGFRRTHNALRNVNVLDTYDFIHGIPDVDNQPNDHAQQYFHGTRVLSLIGGFENNTFSGVAPGATFILAKTENLNIEDPIEEDYFVQAVEWGEKKGIDMISTSLGYSEWYKHSDFDGKTAVTTRIINWAEMKGIVSVVANGNYGANGLDAPADAFYALSIGAVDGSGNVIHKILTIDRTIFKSGSYGRWKN
jgi:serine protease AprX